MQTTPPGPLLNNFALEKINDMCCNDFKIFSPKKLKEKNGDFDLCISTYIGTYADKKVNNIVFF
jgi:hypothetical protein